MLKALTDAGSVFGGDRWAPPRRDGPEWRRRHHWPGEHGPDDDIWPPWDARQPDDDAVGRAAAWGQGTSQVQVRSDG